MRNGLFVAGIALLLAPLVYFVTRTRGVGLAMPAILIVLGTVLLGWSLLMLSAARRCGGCGQGLARGARFCARCGERV